MAPGICRELRTAAPSSLDGAVRDSPCGDGAACAALDMPIVSGNVSLYNETDGQPILPTPTIGAVGLIPHLDQRIGDTPQPGDFAYVIGDTAGHLGASALLAEVFNRTDGPPPPVDLEAERRHGEFVLAHAKWITAAVDLSDGGLALAAFEMAEAAGLGLHLDEADTPTLFGEDQGRYLVAAGFETAELLCIEASKAGIPITKVGRFTGDKVRIGSSEASLSELSHLFRTAFETTLA